MLLYNSDHTAWIVFKDWCVSSAQAHPADHPSFSQHLHGRRVDAGICMRHHRAAVRVAGMRPDDGLERGFGLDVSLRQPHPVLDAARQLGLDALIPGPGMAGLSDPRHRSWPGGAERLLKIIIVCSSSRMSRCTKRSGSQAGELYSLFRESLSGCREAMRH